METQPLILVGHLQVMDEPLSSLYATFDNHYFLSLRLYEDTPGAAYLFTEVSPQSVVKYMERKIGLFELFITSLYYQYKGDVLRLSDMIPLTQEETAKKLKAYSSLNNMFDKHLAYKSVNLKQYLQNLK